MVCGKADVAFEGISAALEGEVQGNESVLVLELTRAAVSHEPEGLGGEGKEEGGKDCQDG